MRITIPTIGSRGDVQPFIALAQGLKQAGHSVTLASHPTMKKLVESHGVTFAPIGPNIDIAQEAAAIRHRAGNAIVGLIQGMRFGFRMLESCHDDILTQCRKTDLVIVPTAIAAGKNEAELSSRPYLSVTLMPWAIPWDDPARPLFKRTIYRTLDILIHLVTTLPLNRIRNKQGLPPVGKEGFTSSRLNLVPVSPAVFEENPLWEPHHHLVGYWFAQKPDNWRPNADLLSFLENGEPPVLISLGAMSLGKEDALASAKLFVDAIQQAGIRAIIQGWETGIKQLTLPATIYAVGSLPHSWLLPRCTGIVHHGGYGTTSAGLQAGIPALLIPHVSDQFYWGQQINKLGTGPKPIPRKKIDKDGLAASLNELIRDKNLHARAAALGKQISTENGIGNAIRLIEETFA